MSCVAGRFAGPFSRILGLSDDKKRLFNRPKWENVPFIYIYDGVLFGALKALPEGPLFAVIFLVPRLLFFYIIFLPYCVNTVSIKALDEYGALEMSWLQFVKLRKIRNLE